MHELPVTQEMFFLVIKYAKSNNAKKINSIKLKIGALSTIIPENVKFYFEILSKDLICPKCRGENVFMKPDTGFFIKSITID